jgi:hypothetical protein
VGHAFAYTEYRFEDKAMQRYSWEGDIRPPATVYGGEIGAQPNDAFNKKYTFFQKANLNYLFDEKHSLNLNSVYNYARGVPSDPLLEKVIGYKSNFNSNMNSWVVGLNHEYNSLNKKLSNSFTVKSYSYSMETKLVELYGVSGITEDVDMSKHDLGVSNSIRYRFTPEFLVKSSVGYDVRLPSEEELLGDGFIIAPAGNLEPERNTSFNLGFIYETNPQVQQHFQFEISGFYMQLENMIRFTGGPLQSKYENFGEMRTIGGEIEVKWDALED